MIDSDQERSTIQSALKHTTERVMGDVLLKVYLKDPVATGNDTVIRKRDVNANDFKPVMDEFYDKQRTVDELMNNYRERACVALRVYEGYLESMRKRVIWILSSGERHQGDDVYLKETEQELETARQLIASHCNGQDASYH